MVRGGECPGSEKDFNSASSSPKLPRKSDFNLIIADSVLVSGRELLLL
jgi:hypothetical protein